MALSSPASLLKTWFRAVRKHPSASEDLPALGDPKHPLSTEPSPTRWTVTAQGAHPDAHTWKNSHSNLGIAADRIGRAGSAHPGWQPSTKMAQQKLGQRPSLLQRSMARQAASGRDGGEREVGEKKNERGGGGQKEGRGKEEEGGPSRLFKLPTPPSSRQNILSLK